MFADGDLEPAAHAAFKTLKNSCPDKRTKELQSQISCLFFR